jgi:hypothetical protein
VGSKGAYSQPMSLRWVKPSKCNNEACVELLKTDREVFLRNSERPDVVMFLSHEDWKDFLEKVKAGYYDE